MADEKTVQFLKSHLFSVTGAKVFAIIDGASVPSLLQDLASFDPEHICLYRGELEPDMAEAAPYLAFLERESEFTKWLLSKGWGEHWGIFGVTFADLPTLRKHFRKFLMVYDESGKSLYFRYYDPRVLRVYLPTCNAGELKTVFGPVLSYLVEDENPKAGRKFMLAGDALQEDKVMLG
jgi:hypothetical protein